MLVVLIHRFLITNSSHFIIIIPTSITTIIPIQIQLFQYHLLVIPYMTRTCKDWTTKSGEYSLSGEVCRIRHKQENSI